MHTEKKYIEWHCGLFAAYDAETADHLHECTSHKLSTAKYFSGYFQFNRTIQQKA